MVTAPLIYAQMAKVMGAVGAVTKGRRNQQQGYQFRGIDDVQAHVQAVLAEHGVICVPRVVEREREVMPTKSGGSMVSVRFLVEHTFYASDGSHVVCTTVGEAMDSGDKASNKAMSAALKYALTETLMIPTYEVDRDTEEHSPEVAPQRVQERPTPQERPRATAPTPAGFDAFGEVVELLQRVFPGDEGRADRLSWFWDRFKTRRDEVMPEGWNPAKAFNASDDKRKAKVLETAKALVESEVHPDDRK